MGHLRRGEDRAIRKSDQELTIARFQLTQARRPRKSRLTFEYWSDVKRLYMWSQAAKPLQTLDLATQ